MNENVIKAALLGFGTVGTGVYKVLKNQEKEMSAKIGCKVEIKKILVRNIEKAAAKIEDASLLTSQWDEIINDPEIEIVIELMGGINPAKEYILSALKAGKHVVSANKDLIAVHGHELLDAAHESKVDFLFEAAVAGGIPIIRPLKQCLAGNHMTEVMGIVNGTTNFILTKMTQEGMEFKDALALATELGYAEADPTADIEGLDAGRKVAILASVAFNSRVVFNDVYTEGIAKITSKDIHYAKEMGQLSMVVSAPCAMGLAVLAQPIVFLLYGNSTGLAANLLILGSFSILLNGMSNISNGVLQAIGQQRIPVITAAIALVVDIVVVVVLLFTTNLGVYALLIAMVIYSVVVCVLNDRAMKKYLQYKNPWKEGYLYPVLASVPMGIVAGCICYGLNIFVKSNFICLIVSIPVAAVVYLFAYLIISKPSESQLRRIPGGSYLIRIAEKLPFWQNN